MTKSDTSEPSYNIYGKLLGNVPEKDKYIRSVPRNMANLFFDYTVSKTHFRGLGMNFGIRYTEFTYSSDANSIKVPAYTVFDIGAHYDFGNMSAALKGLHAQLALSNLTNERYLTSCYGKAGCSYGQGRRVYGNLSYSW